MTVAVLLAAPGMSARLAEVSGQLRAAGAAQVHELAGVDRAADLRAVAAIARSIAEPLLLCSADLVANDSVVLILATEPAGRTYALTSSAPGPVREERGRVTAVGGQAGTSFLGSLRIAVPDLAMAAECCERAAQRAADGDPSHGARRNATQPAFSATDLLLRELVESGVAVMASRIRLLHAERVADAGALPGAVAAVAAVDEDAARLRYAVKERDDFFTTYFVSPYSPYLARWAARLGLSPAAVTAGSVVLAALAAGAFAIASRPAMVAGALLLYAGFVLDCVDGQLARYTRRFSAFGGWLDTMADRFKEYLVYAGLAAGAGGGAWWLALAAMALQTVRHSTDTWYGLLHDEAVARRAGSPAGQTDRGGVLGRVSDRVLADAGSVAYWLKRVVVFPIGERWATIALVAALFDGRTALAVVLAWGGFAFAYTLSLRGLRSLRMRVPVLTTVDISRQRDDGPLVRHLLARAQLAAPLATAALAVLAGGLLVVAHGDWQWAAAVVVLTAGLSARASHAGPLDWLVPAALRAAEYLFVVGAGIAGDVPHPVIFVLLLALAMHHYDLTARPSPEHLADLGWDGRVVLLAAATAGSVGTPVAAVLAVYLWLVLGVRVVAGWFPRARRPRPEDGRPAGAHSGVRTGRV
jgi:hypothetical protein